MMLNDHKKICATHIFTAGVLRHVEDLKEFDTDTAKMNFQYVVGIATGILVSGLFDEEELKSWFVNYLAGREKKGDEFDIQALCDTAEQAIEQANDYVLTREGSVLLIESQETE